VSDVEKGIHYLHTGFKLIWHPRLRLFVFIPLLINSICFLLLFIVAYHYFGHLNQQLLSYLPTWLHWVRYFSAIAFFIAFFMIFIFTFTTLANIITAPFNSFLSEKVTALLTGKCLPSQNWLSLLKDIPRLFLRQISLLIYYLPRALFIFILCFIPIVQLFASLWWFLFHAWFMSLTYLDYPTDTHKIPLAQVKNWMRNHRLLSFVFGSSILIANMIPFINLLVMSAAVIGATEIWLTESAHAAPKAVK
jgi:CysZ protein